MDGCIHSYKQKLQYQQSAGLGSRCIVWRGITVGWCEAGGGYPTPYVKSLATKCVIPTVLPRLNLSPNSEPRITILKGRFERIFPLILREGEKPFSTFSRSIRYIVVEETGTFELYRHGLELYFCYFIVMI